jgi:F420-non-reducing hydrogenase small subunit
MADKLKFGFYWAASCGGCEIAVVDVNEAVLDVVAHADIVLWPVAIDTKYDDVRAFPDGFMDVCFFNGSVRNSEQEEMAHLMRRKSKALVAFGACACQGSIPGLANLHRKADILETVYQTTASTENPNRARPQTRLKVAQGELTLPEFYDRVSALDDVVDVDYYLPGCPPPVPLILNAVTAIFSGQLPPKGTVLAPAKTLCDECVRNQHVAKKMPGLKRTWELAADREKCFLEQGVICMGPATRAGCQTRCINGNSPCSGCMGASPEVSDQGAKMVSALSGILRVDDEKDLSEQDTAGLVNRLADPVGSLYMYSLAKSTLNPKRGGSK